MSSASDVSSLFNPTDGADCIEQLRSWLPLPASSSAKSRVRQSTITSSIVSFFSRVVRQFNRVSGFRESRIRIPRNLVCSEIPIVACVLSIDEIFVQRYITILARELCRRYVNMFI